MARHARARAANAVGVAAGMFSLIADSGVILFVSGVSNLIGLEGMKELVVQVLC